MSVFSLLTETDAYHYTDFGANRDSQIVCIAFVVLPGVVFKRSTRLQVTVILQKVKIRCPTRLFDTFATRCTRILEKNEGVLGRRLR
jgi:hypothetical protein